MDITQRIVSRFIFAAPFLTPSRVPGTDRVVYSEKRLPREVKEELEGLIKSIPGAKKVSLVKGKKSPYFVVYVENIQSARMVPVEFDGYEVESRILPTLKSAEQFTPGPVEGDRVIYDHNQLTNQYKGWWSAGNPFNEPL